MSPASELPPVPVGQTREFWMLMAYALLLGVVGAAAGLVFLGVTDAGNNWYDAPDPGWFGGRWWWVAVTAGAGVVVAVLRHITKLPAKIPGLIADIEGAHVDTRLVAGIATVSAVSLIGGASLGPEQALGAMGGGAATWMAGREGLDDEDAEANVLNGFAGAYGGLFSSTVIVVMLILEVARPGGRKFVKTLVGGIVASSVSFGIYFVIVGAVFLDAYQVPAYTFEDWQLLAAIPLGLLAAVVATVLGASTAGLTQLFSRLPIPSMAKPPLGGAVFGLIGVALPLTLFTGSDQLKGVLGDAGSLGLGLLVAILVGKILAFAVSMGSGFIGGPIFPALFIGGTAGAAVHQAFSGVPLGLAFTCMFAAVPGALVAAPFAMALTAAFMTQVGALQTAPVLIAVVTSSLAMEGVKYLMASRKARSTGPPPRRGGTQAPPPDAVGRTGSVSSGARRTVLRWRGVRRDRAPGRTRLGCCSPQQASTHG
jgi:H+/Cl- antiporter ClcA